MRSRLVTTPTVYPADEDVARTLNLIANHLFNRGRRHRRPCAYARSRAVFHELGEGGRRSSGYLCRPAPGELSFPALGACRRSLILMIAGGAIISLISRSHCMSLPITPPTPVYARRSCAGPPHAPPLPRATRSLFGYLLGLAADSTTDLAIECVSPAFRAGWAEWACNDVQELKQFLAQAERCRPLFR